MRRRRIGEVHSFSYDDDRGEIDVEVINAATDLNLDDGTKMETVLGSNL